MIVLHYCIPSRVIDGRRSHTYNRNRVYVYACNASSPSLFRLQASQLGRPAHRRNARALARAATRRGRDGSPLLSTEAVLRRDVGIESLTLKLAGRTRRAVRVEAPASNEEEQP